MVGKIWGIMGMRMMGEKMSKIIRKRRRKNNRSVG